MRRRVARPGRSNTPSCPPRQTVCMCTLRTVLPWLALSRFGENRDTHATAAQPSNPGTLRHCGGKRTPVRTVNVRALDIRPLVTDGATLAPVPRRTGGRCRHAHPSGIKAPANEVLSSMAGKVHRPLRSVEETFLTAGVTRATPAPAYRARPTSGRSHVCIEEGK